MYGTQDASHICQLDYVTLICGELGGFRRGKHSAALFHNANEDVRMALHGEDFVCLSDDDGLNQIDKRLESKYTGKRHGNTGIRRVSCEKSSVVKPCDRSWDRSDWTVLGHRTRLETCTTHLQSIWMAKTKTVRTPREKLQDNLVLDSGKESDFEERRCNTTQICLHEAFIVGPRQMIPCRYGEAFGPANE